MTFVEIKVLKDGQAGAELCQAKVKLCYPARLGELTKLSKQVWLILTSGQ